MSYQVPTPTHFGSNMSSSRSLSTKFCRSNKYFRCCPPLASVIKFTRLKQLKLQITHHQVYVHIGAQTTPQSDKPPLIHNHSHFSVLCTQTSISICDPKGFCSAEGCNVHVRIHSVLVSELRTLTWDTLHPSAG